MQTIAIINNEKHFRASLRMGLENAGYQVREYPNTQDALELCDNPVDLALLDKNNPPFDGIILYKRIRIFHGMPIIIMSAWASEVQQELIECRRPAQAVIDLPASQREIIGTIRTVLSSKPF